MLGHDATANITIGSDAGGSTRTGSAQITHLRCRLVVRLVAPERARGINRDILHAKGSEKRFSVYRVVMVLVHADDTNPNLDATLNRLLNIGCNP